LLILNEKFNPKGIRGIQELQLNKPVIDSAQSSFSRAQTFA
jgi:hypothetical protein